MLDLDRTTVPVRLANLMAEDIDSGRWTGRLPGYRILSGHYGVSRVTCDAAFILLEKRGILAPAEPRKSRRIVGTAGAGSSGKAKSGTLLILTDQRHQVTENDPLLHRVGEYWNRYRGPVKNVSGDLGRYKKPRSRLESWIKRENAACVALYVAPGSWAEAAEAIGIPYYLFGGTWPKDTPPPAGSGHELIDTYRIILERLASLGHRRILAPTHLSRKRLRGAMMTAYERVFGDKLTKTDRERWVAEFPHFDPDVWQSYWTREFSRLDPTAVVVENSFELLSLYGYCAERGIRIPRDLSVVCASDEEELNWVHPRPVRMHYPDDKAVRHFQNWVRSDYRKRSFEFLTMEWLDGKSIAPPRKTCH